MGLKSRAVNMWLGFMGVDAGEQIVARVMGLKKGKAVLGSMGVDAGGHFASVHEVVKVSDRTDRWRLWGEGVRLRLLAFLLHCQGPSRWCTWLPPQMHCSAALVHSGCCLLAFACAHGSLLSWRLGLFSCVSLPACTSDYHSLKSFRCLYLLTQGLLSCT